MAEVGSSSDKMVGYEEIDTTTTEDIEGVEDQSPSSAQDLDSNATEEEESSVEHLTRNSMIRVNVDDLSPGMIVATYTHSNGNLYQGVLLHINRE